MLIEKDYPESIIIRNAGANVNPVIGEIKDIMQDKDIRKIVVAAHTDCEAMKKVYNVINKSDSAIEDLEQNLISLFRGMKFKDINELEKLNLEMQVDKLKNEFPDLEIIGKMINTSEIKGDKDTLRFYYKEFDKFAPYCKFSNCLHFHEPDCAVKKAVKEGLIPKERYDSYIRLLTDKS